MDRSGKVCKHDLFIQFTNYNTFSVPRKKSKPVISLFVILRGTACIESP